jgi:soluble lytic murein transglycosylase-like protein
VAGFFISPITPTSSDYVLYIREKTVGLKMGITSRNYDTIIHKAQAKYGVAVSLIKVVIHAESGFDALAVSKKGAKGLMQIMPDNYKVLSISDPFDPSQSIMGRGDPVFKAVAIVQST